MTHGEWSDQHYIVEARGKRRWSSVGKWIEVFNNQQNRVLHSDVITCRRRKFARFLEGGLTLYDESGDQRPIITIRYPSALLNATHDSYDNPDGIAMLGNVALCDVLDCQQGGIIGALAHEIAALHKVHKMSLLGGVGLLDGDWTILNENGQLIRKLVHLSKSNPYRAINYVGRDKGSDDIRVRMRMLSRINRKTDLKFAEESTGTIDPLLMISFVAFRVALSVVAPRPHT